MKLRLFSCWDDAMAFANARAQAAKRRHRVERLTRVPGWWAVVEEVDA